MPLTPVVINAGGLLTQTGRNATMPLGPLTLAGGTYNPANSANNAGPYALTGTVTVNGDVTSVINNTSAGTIPLGAANVVNWLDSTFTVAFDVADGLAATDLLVTGANGLGNGVTGGQYNGTGINDPNPRMTNLVKTGAGTLVLLLATASLGAVFCSVAPEFGTQSVVDRLGQIEPVVLLAVDGYRYGDKPVSREAEVTEVLAALPSVRAVVHLPYLDATSTGPASTDARTTVLWDDLHPDQREVVAFEPVAFDHPLYVLFSSGTTGLPKPILHGHGGITLGHAAALGLFTDLGPDDRFSWFSTTGWMMWNYLVSGLLVGSTVVLFDGNPAHPTLMSQWELAAEMELTYYGTSAPFLMTCRKAGLRPGDEVDLSRLRGVGSTGAPLPAEGFAWVHDAVSATAQVGSISGGTDVCNAFVGPTPLTPVWEGEIPARLPGIGVEAYAESALGAGDWHPVVGEVGELVLTRPMPSMPVGFWGDEDGSRYQAAYFEEIPGVWRHGDWVTVTEHGSLVITGRSDATLNRGGVRLGTSEFYRVVEELPEVKDSLVVHLEDGEGGAGELVLFVALAPGASEDGLAGRVATELRTRLSPRHVPDTLHVVRSLPRTLSGKRLEVPVKKILRGADPAAVVAAGALDDPAALTELAAYAAGRG